MVQAIRTIPIDHHATVHEIDATRARSGFPMTLLELVHAVDEVSESEREVVATVSYMLRSGRIRLMGSFRDTPADQLCD